MEIPEWYWIKGLHDSEILNVTYHNIDYDYTQRNPIRNYIEIQLDSKNAMFDTTIEKIRLFNSKIILGDIDFIGWFWKEDVLIQKGKHFNLEITLVSYPNIKKCQISFENATVERV